MKQYRVIGASIFFCLSFLGCKNYENQKDKMIRFVCDYKAMQIENGNVDYENLCDLNRILSRFRDTMQMSLIEYCSQKREQSERDLKLSQQIRLSEYDLMTGSSRAALDKMKPMNYYEQDLKKLKSILMKTDSLALNSDMYAKTISGYFTMALSKLKKKNKADADFMGLLLFFAGNSQIISDKYEIVYNAYYDAVRFLITEPEFWISDYCNIVLKTIKAFSAKLEADEFYSIYMDMVNHTAADYLGPDLVDIINTYTRYAYVTDKETEFEKYLANSLE